MTSVTKPHSDTPSSDADLIQEWGEESFPASDPPSSPMTHLGAPHEPAALAKPALINAVIDPTAGTESGHIQHLNPKSALASKISTAG